MDDFDIAIDEDLIKLVDEGKLDPWQAAHCQLRRDFDDLKKKVEASDSVMKLNISRRR
jgi:hypothetical protein